MVCLAYLLGSDYTAGLDGVGVVNAMEVIGQFRGEGINTLRKFKEWHTQMNSAPGLTFKSSFERKLRDLDLPADFPSEAVWQAYMSPEVDNSTEQFQWGTPDLDLIRKYPCGFV
jgi:DNA excision repair protein ERCC-5